MDGERAKAVAFRHGRAKPIGKAAHGGHIEIDAAGEFNAVESLKRAFVIGGGFGGAEGKLNRRRAAIGQCARAVGLEGEGERLAVPDKTTIRRERIIEARQREIEIDGFKRQRRTVLRIAISGDAVFDRDVAEAHLFHRRRTVAAGRIGFSRGGAAFGFKLPVGCAVGFDFEMDHRIDEHKAVDFNFAFEEGKDFDGGAEFLHRGHAFVFGPGRVRQIDIFDFDREAREEGEADIAADGEIAAGLRFDERDHLIFVDIGGYEHGHGHDNGHKEHNDTGENGDQT